MERIKKAIEANERIEHKKREDFWHKQELEAKKQEERLIQNEKMNEAKIIVVNSTTKKTGNILFILLK